MSKIIAKRVRRGRTNSRKVKPPPLYLLLWETWATKSDRVEPEVDWDSVIASVERNHRIALYSDDERRGMLLLHLACALHPTLQALHVILAANPNAIYRKSLTGLTPLHIAVGRNASRAAVRWLIQQNPKAVAELDENGYAPLHWACRQDVGNNIVRLLLQTDISTARSRPEVDSGPTRPRQSVSPLEIVYQNRGTPSSDSSGSSPWDQNQWGKLECLLWANHYGKLFARNGQTFSTLYAALALDCPKDVIDVALKLHGASVCGVRDIHGNLPLHYAVKARGVDRNGLTGLLELFPLAAASTDASSQLPLHQAIRNGKTWSGGVREIYEAYPLALTLPDGESSDPLPLTAALHCDVETIFCLFREYPQMLQKAL